MRNRTFTLALVLTYGGTAIAGAAATGKAASASYLPQYYESSFSGTSPRAVSPATPPSPFVEVRLTAPDGFARRCAAVPIANRLFPAALKAARAPVAAFAPPKPAKWVPRSMVEISRRPASRSPASASAVVFPAAYPIPGRFDCALQISAHCLPVTDAVDEGSVPVRVAAVRPGDDGTEFPFEGVANPLFRASATPALEDTGLLFGRGEACRTRWAAVGVIPPCEAGPLSAGMLVASDERAPWRAGAVVWRSSSGLAVALPSSEPSGFGDEDPRRGLPVLLWGYERGFRCVAGNVSATSRAVAALPGTVRLVSLLYGWVDEMVRISGLDVAPAVLPSRETGESHGHVQ